MDCFTSPTTRLSNPPATLFSSSGRKFSHWTVDVSWNSSRRKSSNRTPSFSYTNGASDPSMMPFRMVLESSMERTFFSFCTSSKAFRSSAAMPSV